MNTSLSIRTHIDIRKNVNTHVHIQMKGLVELRCPAYKLACIRLCTQMSQAKLQDVLTPTEEIKIAEIDTDLVEEASSFKL